MTFKKRAISILLSLLVILQIGFCCIPTVSATSNQDIIFDFFKSELGFNTATACGILANIEQESLFNPNVYGDHGSSYGICQWHATRFTALKDFCNKNGYNWQTLSGQLQFLKYEMTVENTKLYSKLKSYPNTADGAYSAGYTWCYDFERPANKAQNSVKRGNSAKTKFWPLYGCTVTKPTVSVTKPANATTTITEGNSLSVEGKIYAKGAKTTIKGYIKDSSGKTLQTATDSVSSTIDIKSSAINSKLLFGKLKVGTYSLYITAQNSKGTTTVTKKIVVKAHANPKVQSVKIDDVKITYSKQNNTVTIKPTISVQTGAKYTTTWTSSDKSVATVNSSGKVTALKSGTTTITCTLKDSYGTVVKDTCKVTVSLNWWEWIVTLILKTIVQYV